MCLLHTVRLNGLKPYAYLMDVLERLPTKPASAMTELLPTRLLAGDLNADASGVKMTWPDAYLHEAHGHARRL